MLEKMSRKSAIVVYSKKLVLSKQNQTKQNSVGNEL